MPSPTNWLLVLLAALPSSAAALTFHASGGEAGGWPAILSSIGLQSSARGDVEVIPAGAVTTDTDWHQRVEHGTILILEGASPLAESFGFHAGSQHMSVQSLEDLRAPQLRIIWEQALDVPVFDTSNAVVFARERWSKAPLVAGFRRGSGAVLWVAAPPGPHGYDRFPYLPQALADLGLTAPFRSARLWAFFDSAYRSRVDLDYFAPRWRQAGIAALHIAAWHYWEPDPHGDEYLRRLIEACHRNGIQVYAWVELPHVSERFWDQHPEWREKTALLQDAQLDWRKLMNLTNRAAFAETARGLRSLVDRFDWDGVNLAELYFESLEGHDNPARFTPMNRDVRAEFLAASGIDPLDLFDLHKTSTAGMVRFLEFRAELARRQQAEWIAQLEDIRKTKSWLDLALTHVDDRFDPSMREKIGADTSKTLPLLAQHDFTFLIEDPATIWHLGPQRYPQIAARYAGLTPRAEKLAIDINIVERYQDVYPTKQQTGSELFALLHSAAAAFPRVAVYFENSILAPDLPLLPFAAAEVQHAERTPEKTVVQSQGGVGAQWTGPALVDGKPWPVASDSVIWLAPGAHSIQPAVVQPVLRLIDLNAELHSAAAVAGGMEFAYQSSARALATFETPPTSFQIDGVEAHPTMLGNVVMLPRGQHVVTALK